MAAKKNNLVKSAVSFRLLQIMFVFLFFALLMYACSEKQDANVDTDASQNGKRIVETGELSAIDSRAFIMPRYGRRWFQMKIIGMLEHGSEVKAGDSIMQLDPTDINRHILERESQLETQLASMEKLLVDQSNRRQDLRSRLQNETATYELKKLELESSQFESDRIKQIKELEFRQATLQLNKVKKLIEYNEIIAASTLKIEQIRIDRLREEIQNAYNLLPELTIRTPISGIFQAAHNRRTNQTVKIGDELYQGNVMGHVPDLTWMKVNTTINEIDYMKINVGQKVLVKLDALPTAQFEGSISAIGKLSRPKNNQSRQKVFEVEVVIVAPDERLKPGMTVSCEFIEAI